MSVSVSDLLDLAHKLLETDTKVTWRSAVSRAYYASLHAAREAAQKLPDNSHFDLDGGTHKYLIDRYTNYNSSDTEKRNTVRRIGYILHDVKKRRERADYDIDIETTKEWTETSLRQNHIILNLLEETLLKQAA